ncbi:outer membrane protein assembly factor BamB [Xanthomonadaceae bacterium JHOS43]|nr:outer membrane protein assembly factor BamB [Xanthomonadaceae bacterium JHOS43]MCX7563492.1 outer membrane protein assembly factor BamB [Xanthomonadaceae bacterium XH05]
MRQALVILLMAGLIAGCGRSSGKRENIEPPAELLPLTTTTSVTQAWQRDLDKGEGRLGTRQHPVSDGMRLYAASPKGGLYAFNAESGAQVWRLDTGLRLSSTPGVGEGTLVVGTLDGDVVAFNPESGSERWRAKVSSEVISAPAVGRGVAVVRSIDGRVFAFSITDGERRWVYDRGTPALTLRGNSAPVMADGLVLVGYDSGQLVALRGDDGVQLWEQAIAFGEGRSELERMVDIDGEMAYDRGEVYAAAFNAQVVGVSLEGGRPLWNRELSSYAGVTLSNQTLFVADRDGVIWALDRNSGAAMWKQDALRHRWLTTPAVHGSHVVVGDLEGYLHWFDAETGNPVARHRLGKKPIRATPHVNGDLLYAVSIDGKLGAYRH